MFGFMAGWTFLLAKSASASAAALGFVGYAMGGTGVADRLALGPAAALTVLVLGAIVFSGIRRSNFVNAVIVAVTIAALGTFVLSGARHPDLALRMALPDAFGMTGLPGVLQATALMFVAYAGFGRLSTVGEEILDPERSIPRSIFITLALTALIYVGVALVALGIVGATAFGQAAVETAAPLVFVAQTAFSRPVQALVSLGAVTAMLSVLLNLILGLSRVLLAMGRRGDMPRLFGVVSQERNTPPAAVAGVTVVIAGLALMGSVRTAWSFSAFSLLIYYGITSLAATRLAPAQRRYPVALAWLGVAACLSIAFFIEYEIMLVGVATLALGVLWRVGARKLGGHPRSP